MTLHNVALFHPLQTYQRRWLLLIVHGAVRPGGASCPQYLAAVYQSAAAGLAAFADLGAGHRGGQPNNSQIQSFSTPRVAQRTGLPGAAGERGLPAAGPIPAAGRNRAHRRRTRSSAATTSYSGSGCGGTSRRPCTTAATISSPPAKRAQMLPFEPSWLIEALGVAEIDPGLPHQGPYFLPNDRLRIDTIRNTPAGPMTKVTILDGSQGWILEQDLYDAQRRPLASSIARGHRRDPLSESGDADGRRDRCPAAQLSMRIDLGNVEINRLSGDPGALWSIPNYPDTPLVEHGRPELSAANAHHCPPHPAHALWPQLGDLAIIRGSRGWTWKGRSAFQKYGCRRRPHSPMVFGLRSKT